MRLNSSTLDDHGGQCSAVTETVQTVARCRFSSDSWVFLWLLRQLRHLGLLRTFLRALREPTLRALSAMETLLKSVAYVGDAVIYRYDYIS